MKNLQVIQYTFLTVYTLLCRRGDEDYLEPLTDTEWSDVQTIVTKVSISLMQKLALLYILHWKYWTPQKLYFWGHKETPIDGIDVKWSQAP